MIILSNIMNFSKNTILNYIISKKYIITIIFIILMCLNYIIIDKTWMHKFMYVKYLSISPDLSNLHVKHRENVINVFASSFNRNNSNPNLSILNLRNSYDIKLFFFGSLNNDEVNKLIDDQVNKTILDVKDRVLNNLNFIQNIKFPIWANDLTNLEIEEQIRFINQLSEKIKSNIDNYEKIIINIINNNSDQINNMENSRFDKKSMLNFIIRIKNFHKNLEKIYFSLDDENVKLKDYNLSIFQASRSHIQLLQELSNCKFKDSTSYQTEIIPMFFPNIVDVKNLCKLQQNLFTSSLDYFYYAYTLKNLINSKDDFYSKSIKKLQINWKNENIIDYDKKLFYEIERVGPSNMLIIIISIFNSLVSTFILSLLLIKLNNKSNIFKN